MRSSTVPAPRQDDSSGMLLGKRYLLRRRIAEGGMGAIYEAEHLAMNKRVAIKVIHSDGATGPDVTRRFEQEATITSNLSDPHIVRVFDAGHDPQHGFFMVMEMLEGEDLAARLRVGGALRPLDACEIVYQAARGLEQAHAAKVIHRDLKPSNIFLVRTRGDGLFAKVLDFGVAKATGGDGRSLVLTRVGATVGTPQYMSPEQAAGLDNVDERTDLYSLGAVLYKAIVGEPVVPAFRSFGRMVVHIATVTAPRVAERRKEIDPRIDRLVAEMTCRDRDARISSMREVRRRLGEILAKKDTSTRRILRAPVARPATGEPGEAGGVEVFERPSMRRKMTSVVEAEDEGAAVFNRASLKLPAAKPIDPDEIEVPIDFEG